MSKLFIAIPLNTLLSSYPFFNKIMMINKSRMLNPVDKKANVFCLCDKSNDIPIAPKIMGGMLKRTKPKLPTNEPINVRAHPTVNKTSMIRMFIVMILYMV